MRISTNFIECIRIRGFLMAIDYPWVVGMLYVLLIAFNFNYNPIKMDD